MASIEVIKTLNSTYELDIAGQRIRRLEGVNPPTLYQGEDGQWQPFTSVIDWGSSMVIEWPHGGHTVTSTILSRVTTDGDD